MGFSTFESLVRERRSVRKFDTSVKVEDEALRRSLELAILSPNSSNMQLWHFVWIKDPKVRKQMTPLCLGQNAAKTADHLVVFLTRRDRWKLMARWNLEKARQDPENQLHPHRLKLFEKYYGKLMPLVYARDYLGLLGFIRMAIVFTVGLFRPMQRFAGRSDQRVILHKSCALAAQTFMLAIQSEGYDSCPMEGFDRVRVKKLLMLPRGSEICMIVAVGKGTEAGIYGSRKRLPMEEVLSII